MSRPQPLSGFPEWSVNERAIELHCIRTVSEVFELHGFASIETRAVEPLGRLGGQAEAAKEVYTVVRRGGGDPEWGLHFDLTVPFARYIEERSGQLAFPFKRYQIQKVWRGERPQEGRFREFYQADIDIVGRDVLPEHLEAEVATVMARALAALPIPAARMHVNNRALVEGFYRGVGIDDVASALRSVDKLDKIGPEGVAKEFETHLGSADIATPCVELAQISGVGETVREQVLALAAKYGIDGDNLDTINEGLRQLLGLVDAVNHRADNVAIADLRIARGLDYYTGAVYETFLIGHEDLGSICSGGRYDSLVSGGGFPGVGMSIGLSRLVSRIIAKDLASLNRGVPTAVLVAVADEATRGQSEDIADALRARGIAAEVSPNAAKFGKQIQYADKRGIPFVWFTDEAGNQVKDIRSGEQQPADVLNWTPPVADLRPSVVAD